MSGIERGAPLDMSLMAPRPERLDQLAKELNGGLYGEMPFEQATVVYQLALKEMEVSALGVVAQFCARMANG